MFALAIPMYLFYEISIVIGRLWNRRKRKAASRGCRGGEERQAARPPSCPTAARTETGRDRPAGHDRRRRVLTDPFPDFPSTASAGRAIEGIDAGRNVLVSAPTGRARPSSVSTPSPGLWPLAQRPLHRPDQGAVQPEVRGSGRRVRPAGGPPHRRPHRQRTLRWWSDHRGAAQHGLRRFAGGRSAVGRARRGAISSRTRTGAGLRRSWSTPRRRSASCARPRRCPTRRSWVSGSGPPGPTDTVIEHVRPIRLDNLYMVGDRRRSATTCSGPVDGRPNPRPTAGDASARRRTPTEAGPAGHGWLAPGRPSLPHAPPARGGRTPRRRGLPPAIYFIFSRAACTDAARHQPGHGAAPDRRRRTPRIRPWSRQRRDAERLDLDALDYDQWLGPLEAGWPPHHAGMVPAFREAVEDCQRVD